MERGPEFEPEIESPVIMIEIEEGDLFLTWFNTRIRTFSDPQFDHVEHTRGEDFLAMTVTQEFMDLLFERNYPYSYDPVIDDMTFEWYVRMNTKSLDSEIEQLE